MRFRGNYRLITFFMIVIIIALLIGFNIDYTKSLIDKYILIYGYYAVFGFGFLADFIMQPIGPEVPAILGLIFGLSFYSVFWIVLLGSYFGSVTSYFVGRIFLSNNISNFCKKESRKKHCKMFRKYGKFALLIACLSPVPYVLFCWLAGAFKMSFFDFIIYGLIPRAFRIFIVLFLFGLFF